MENQKKTYEELEAENAELRNKLSAYEWEGTPEGLASKLYEARRERDAYDYDYELAVKEDAVQAINEMVKYDDLPHELPAFESVEDFIRDMLCEDDKVTGIMSGSYTMNQYDAERNICHNWDLVQEAIEEGFDITAQMFPEMIDVQLRLYILPRVIEDAIKESDLPEEWFWDDDDWADSAYVKDEERSNPGWSFVRHTWSTYEQGEASNHGMAVVDIDGLGYCLFRGAEKDYEDGRGGEL